MNVRFGLIGTGYAAKVRAQALLADRRSHLTFVSGHQHTTSFAATHGLQPIERWQQLVRHDEIDAVVVATVSALHGEIVECALEAGKHVVVEYPLSLNLDEARQLVALAQARNLLLHVEHIELLGGLHVAMRSHLSKIGVPSYVSYRTLNPQNPAPMKWTYNRALFGFPFCGALSRVHRLTNLFGRVSSVSCCTRFVSSGIDPNYFRSVLSSARLEFENGVVAELSYGKGEDLWVYRREIEIQGSLGALAFVKNEGRLVTYNGIELIAVAPRKGLFVKDTSAVLDYLTEGEPLYVSAAESVYALTVGDALRRASESGNTVCLEA